FNFDCENEPSSRRAILLKTITTHKHNPTAPEHFTCRSFPDRGPRRSPSQLQSLSLLPARCSTHSRDAKFCLPRELRQCNTSSLCRRPAFPPSDSFVLSFQSIDRTS